MPLFRFLRLSGFSIRKDGWPVVAPLVESLFAALVVLTPGNACGAPTGPETAGAGGAMANRKFGSDLLIAWPEVSTGPAVPLPPGIMRFIVLAIDGAVVVTSPGV